MKNFKKHIEPMCLNLETFIQKCECEIFSPKVSQCSPTPIIISNSNMLNISSNLKTKQYKYTSRTISKSLFFFGIHFTHQCYDVSVSLSRQWIHYLQVSAQTKVTEMNHNVKYKERFCCVKV